MDYIVINGVRQPQPLREKFNSRYRVDPTGCWIWTSSLSSDGYGALYRGGRGSKYANAHRVSYELNRGSIPDGMCVCHRCDVRACVNPDHLFLGTHADNMRDMFAKGRQPRAIGERNANAKLTIDDVRTIRAMLASGHTRRSIASKFGTSHQTINKIASGVTWVHVPECHGVVPCPGCSECGRGDLEVFDV